MLKQSFLCPCEWNEARLCGRIHLFFFFFVFFLLRRSCRHGRRKQKRPKRFRACSRLSLSLYGVSMRITWKFPIRFCVLSFHLCFCSLVAVVVVAPYDQMERNSTSLLLLLLVGTVTRLIRSRSLRSRGPHSFFLFFFFLPFIFLVEQKGEKLCEREKCAYLSAIVGYVFILSLGRRRLLYYIHPRRLDALYG